MDSSVGTGYVGFRPKETYGWTFPVVGKRNYQFRFTSLIDWQSARVRYVLFLGLSLFCRGRMLLAPSHSLPQRHTEKTRVILGVGEGEGATTVGD